MIQFLLVYFPIINFCSLTSAPNRPEIVDTNTLDCVLISSLLLCLFSVKDMAVEEAVKFHGTAVQEQ